MHNRVILITGGAAGIGAGIASRLVQDGAAVVIADRQEADIPGARFVPCDVADPAQIRSLVDNIAASEARLDGLGAMPGS